MANNKLILRSLQSPWVTPFNDITTNSVLSWGDVDNNFIYLKGELIYSGFTSNNQLILQKINGSQITINGIGGGSTTDVFVTGGTYNNGVATFTNNTGGTFNVNGFYTGSTDVFVTGGTYNNSNGTATFINNTGGTFSLSGFSTVSVDTFVTGGTYDNNTGVATFTDSSGNTFNVTGFLTGYTNYYTTGATLNDTILSFDRTDSLSAYTVDLSSLNNYGNKWFVPSGTTVEVKENYQSFIYGDLYIQGTLLLNDNAQLVVLNGDIILSGGSISGNGTTLLVDLPMVDTYITGGTYSNGNLTLVDNFGDDITINGFYTGSTGDYLPLSGGVMYDNAIIQFDNFSQLREGYNDFGGQGGISQICGVGYENNWQAGINHIFDNNGFIRESRYCFNTIPDNTFDSNSKFKVGSRWVLDNGDVYICSDDTVGSAVWYLEDDDTYITGGTYVTGGTIIFDYSTGGGFQLTGLTEDLNNEIAGLAEADEQTITLNLTTNKIELKETVASATGGTRTFQGDFAISGGTLNLNTIGSGSPVINLGLDSSGFVVTGTTSIPFTGNTSGDCISDIWVSNLHGCSPITIHNSIQSSGSSVNNGFGIAFGDNAIANASETLNVDTPITVISGCSFTSSDPNNGLPAIILSGDVTSEWQIYLWDFCSEFLISGSNGSEILNLGCNISDIYVDNDLTYIVDSALSGSNYSTISGNTFYYVETVFNRPSFTFGKDVIANGIYSHAEGEETTASGQGSHAEGFRSTAQGAYSHAEGYSSTAIGQSSHVEGQFTTASNSYSHAEGYQTRASGIGSHAEGLATLAYGQFSHTEGLATTANGQQSHAEGQSTTASGDYSHAEGYYSIAQGNSSHAEGGNSSLGSINGKGGYALGAGSHAEGTNTTASNQSAHAEGYLTKATGQFSHSEGFGTTASNDGAHAEGNSTTASGQASHSEGVNTIASGLNSHAEGQQTTANGQASHAEGQQTVAIGNFGSHAEGSGTTATGIASHSEGRATVATGNNSHSEGRSTTALGNNSHAEGLNTTASGPSSHAEGQYTTASGIASHTEGSSTSAIGDYSHSEGVNTKATGNQGSHAEGSGTLAAGQYSHAEGSGTTASGNASHAEGSSTTASGLNSHAEGQQTTAVKDFSHSGGINSIANGLASFIHSSGSTVNGDRSVVLGGSGITGSTSDTVYVPDFVIKKVASTPTSSGDTVGEIGSITWDNSYFYVKTATGWGRIALDYTF